MAKHAFKKIQRTVNVLTIIDISVFAKRQGHHHLKTTPFSELKILVYGNQNWSGKGNFCLERIFTQSYRSIIFVVPLPSIFFRKVKI